MSIDADDEILQDFLVEAGEILERLNEELVELEQRPGDVDLLNAVFRGFHTIKGGASFLSLEGLVGVCHHAEDVFNVLRNGQRSVDTALMDTVLQVLDVVNSMFAEVQGGNMPTPAPAALLKTLETLAVPAGASVAETAEPVPDAALSADVDAADAEFEAMLEQSSPAATSTAEDAPSTVTVSGGDDITEDEFEALLDQLHGAGKAPTPTTDAKPGTPNTAATAGAKPAVAVSAELPGDKSKAPAGLPANKAEATVRVDTKRLDDIMNMVGELVLARNRLATLKESMANEDMSKAIANLDVVTADLQNAVMKTRMQPIKKVFGRFPRVVRDLARSLNKEVNLELQGEETDLDKNLVEALADPLVHLVRNAVDHGIESPEDREATGKPRAGTVILAAEQEGDHILLSIEDDGKGMDPARLRQKAVEKGLMDAEAAARLDDRDTYNLIFAAGFSTKDEISDVSGRGVGMDVVKTRIGQLNGTVEIDSELGKGTRLMIRVPLTLAIMPTLMVKLGAQPFALPLGSVSEIFDLDETRTNVVDGQLVVMVRNKALPLFYLREWLVTDAAKAQTETVSHVVVVHVGSQKVGFVVEQLVGQEEVVIKPLGAFLQGLAGFAGATITGDGRIALILDVPSLMKAYARHM
jgi:two-component system chemotaxis sensor kinase CheA